MSTANPSAADADARPGRSMRTPRALQTPGLGVSRPTLAGTGGVQAHILPPRSPVRPHGASPPDGRPVVTLGRAGSSFSSSASAKAYRRAAAASSNARRRSGRDGKGSERHGGLPVARASRRMDAPVYRREAARARERGVSGRGARLARGQRGRILVVSDRRIEPLADRLDARAAACRARLRQQWKRMDARWTRHRPSWQCGLMTSPSNEAQHSPRTPDRPDDDEATAPGPLSASAKRPRHLVDVGWLECSPRSRACRADGRRR